MKIVFCIDSLNKGGAERVLSNLVNYLCAENDIYIITTSSIKSNYSIDKRVTVKSLDNDNKVNKITKNYIRIKNLKKIMKTIHPDLIITFMPPQSFRVLSIKKRLDCPVVVSIRNDPNQEYAKLKNKIAMKILYRKADGFIFQTYDAKKYFSKNIQKKSAIIPNPINSDFLLSKRFTGNRNKEIVCVGRLEKQKNYIFMLDTYKELLKIRKDYKLVIYGEGSLREELQNYIDNNGMKDNVLLKGQIDNVKERIQTASIYVLPSLYEGMPNALMEAMALGIPCISTDCPCGGPKFLIKNNHDGLLVSVNDQKQLLKALMRYINDVDFANKCGTNAFEKMKEFSVEKNNKLWINYIKNILDNRGK